MKKVLLLLLTFSLACLYVNAQSKVFKEVSEDISSQVAPITQDGALVGYLVFARLEKASEDSFNYRVTIMDENLNDIGAVNFREESIYLRGVAFEQDVLCMAYLKSNVFLKTFSNSKTFRKENPNSKNSIMLQFLGLDGKILRTNTSPVNINMEQVYTTYRKVTAYGQLKHDIQLINIPRQGFACYYGDEDKNLLSVYRSNGTRLWQKKITEEPAGPALLSSGAALYMVVKSKVQTEHTSYDVQSFGVIDSVEYPKYTLKDKKGHNLDILAFENNPLTGKPFLSGSVLSGRRSSHRFTAPGISQGYYAGTYTVNFEGHGKADIKEVFSYWDDNSNSSISAKGYYRGAKVYADLRLAFKDYSGNSYFVGNSFVKRTKWGVVAASVITAPLILPPLGIMMMLGTRKAKLKDPILIKQDAKGNLSYEITVPTSKNRFRRGMVPFSYLGYRGFSTVVNNEKKKHYLIVNDGVNTGIYDVEAKKVMRTIPAKDGKILTSVFPAKEGSIMVAEYNKKEKYTRISIESL